MMNRTIAAIAMFVWLVLPVIAATPRPAVRGPLPVTAASYPFGAADHTLTHGSVFLLHRREHEVF